MQDDISNMAPYIASLTIIFGLLVGGIIFSASIHSQYLTMVSHSEKADAVVESSGLSALTPMPLTDVGMQSLPDLNLHGSFEDARRMERSQREVFSRHALRTPPGTSESVQADFREATHYRVNPMLPQATQSAPVFHTEHIGSSRVRTPAEPPSFVRKDSRVKRERLTVRSQMPALKNPRIKTRLPEFGGF